MHRGFVRILLAAALVAVATWGIQHVETWTPARLATSVFLVVAVLGWALGAPGRAGAWRRAAAKP